MAASQAHPQAPPVKRSVFNKPAWANSAPAPNELDPEDSTDFFRRSARTFPNISAEQEARRKKRKARKEQEDAARGSSKEGSAKRQRTTESAEENEALDSKHLSKGHARGVKDAKSNARPLTKSPSPSKSRDSPKVLAKQYEPKSNSIAAAKAELECMMSSNIISLDSDEEADRDRQNLSKPVTASAPSKRSEIADIELSDDEELFPELARKARDAARQKRLEEAIPKDPDPIPTTNAKDKSPAALGTTDPSNAFKNGESTFDSSRSQPLPPNPVVSIFVQSDIPDTTPFILNRKLHQRLKEVRKYWCKRQNFTPELADSIILTWRGRRIFDVTSCAALGLEVNGEGKVVIRGETSVFSDDEEDGGAQIHMEAMTEETFEERQRKKDASQRAEEDASDEDEVEEVFEAEKEEQIRITLKSKGYKEFYLLVKHVSNPHLSVEDIITFLLGPFANSGIVYNSSSYHQSLSIRKQSCY